MAKRASGLLVARHAERTADVLAAGIAGHRFLRELLHRRIDGEVDGKADIDRRAPDVDAVRPVTVPGGRVLLHCRRIGVHAVERTRRPAQGRERLQHHLERGRHLPALVVDRKIRRGFARDAGGRRGPASIFGEREHLRTRAQLCLGCAGTGHEIRRHRRVSARRRVAHEDAAGQAAPRVGTRDLSCGDLDELLRAPARDHARHFGSAPGEHAEHAAIRACEGRRSASEIRALHGELASGIVRRLDRQA